MERLLFKEEQRFRQWWLWLILNLAAGVSIIPFLVGIYFQEVLGKPLGNNPASTLFLVFFLIFDTVLIGGVIFMIYKMRLTVEVRTTGLWFRYPPLAYRWKCFAKEEIERFEIRTYRPVSEYGGWGIKGGSRNKAYNVSGNIGLQLYLKDGKKVLFGTEKKQALEYAINKMMKGERVE